MRTTALLCRLKKRAAVFCKAFTMCFHHSTRLGWLDLDFISVPGIRPAHGNGKPALPAKHANDAEYLPKTRLISASSRIHTPSGLVGGSAERGNRAVS
jgi:hypothetical protein